MKTLERLGAITIAVIVVGLLWAGAGTAIRWWSDLPPICASIGGGCR